MGAVFNVTIPFFALVLIGWLAGRAGFFPATAVKGLSWYVLHAALPSMLLLFVLNTSWSALLDPVVIAVYGAGAVFTVLLAFWVSRWSRSSVRDAAFSALVAASPNIGFMGVALVTRLLGPSATGPVIATMLFDILFTSTLCIALAEGKNSAEGGRRAAMAAALRGMAANPLPWGIGVGMLMSALNWSLPAPIHAMAKMLADSATPVALCAIGASLAMTRPSRAASRADGSVSHEIWYLSIIKVAVHPLAIWLIASLATWAGFDMTRGQTSALILVAALPSAGNAMMLAARYGADPSRISLVVLMTTLATPLTFTALATLLIAA